MHKTANGIGLLYNVNISPKCYNVIDIVKVYFIFHEHNKQLKNQRKISGQYKPHSPHF
jgi:uncharacterized protein YfbU (UPF0304 family)